MPVGPGKYEGEGAETYILDQWMGFSGQDEMVSDPDNGDGAALFLFGTERIGNLLLSEAVEHGWSQQEVHEATSRIKSSVGAILTWSSVGFVGSQLFYDRARLEAAWAELEIAYDEGGES